jgi:hypothetical protein
MIRVPSITMVRPWPGAFGRRRKARADTTSSEAEQALLRRRLEASIDIERAADFSAQFAGRKLF